MSAARHLEIQQDYNSYEVLKPIRKKASRQATQTWSSVIVASIVLALLFALLLTVVNRYAVISETKYAIFNLKKEVKALSMKKEALIFEIETAVALDNVEKVSMEQLGMAYPSQGQMIYISAAKGYNLTVADAFNATEQQETTVDFVDYIGAVAARFKR